jgi:hypothetical protein
MSMIAELTFFRYPSQADEAGHFCTSSQVLKELDEEIQHI